MGHNGNYRLGDLQLKIMQVLWHESPLSVGDVQQRLDDDLAYTTVATMLRKMEDRRLVSHIERERRFYYSAAIKADDVKKSMAADLVDRLFAGSLSAAVSHLLDDREVSSEELAGLEELIQRRKRETKT